MKIDLILCYRFSLNNCSFENLILKVHKRYHSSNSFLKYLVGNLKNLIHFSHKDFTQREEKFLYKKFIRLPKNKGKEKDMVLI